MNKTVIKVFGVVAILVAIFMAWQLIFNDGGIIKSVYNAVARGINTQWEKVSGSDDLMPLWEDSGADTNGKGFEIDVN